MPHFWFVMRLTLCSNLVGVVTVLVGQQPNIFQANGVPVWMSETPATMGIIVLVCRVLSLGVTVFVLPRVPHFGLGRHRVFCTWGIMQKNVLGHTAFYPVC